MKKIDIRDIRSEEILAVNRGENTLFQRRENLSKHTSYARERMQYDAIRSGQVEQILSLLQQKPDGTEGILSKDQLRNSKNMFIAGITLFTRAAIDGGVPEETAYSLSDGYIQTVEECTNSVSIGCTDQSQHKLLKSDGHHQAYKLSGECRVFFIFHLFLPMPPHRISVL